MGKRGAAAVLEMPEREHTPSLRMRSRRDAVEDFADEYDTQPDHKARLRSRPAVKLRVGGRLPLPTTVWGMAATGAAMVLLLGSVFWLLAVTRIFLLHDVRFQIAGASAIEIVGNHHLRRGQLVGLFSDDLERNIFGVSLERRQADLEAMPWVERATVMRLLPGRLRVAVVERTPVAFVRQGGLVELVDRDGVLLDMAPGANAEHYTFLVVTGIAASDPASVRMARMRLFAQFTAELDAGGVKNTESLSEIDLSNPEDVRAIVEEKGTTLLVHFGEENFRERFDRMRSLLPQWRAQYPNLASADMRYEHEIPLAMAKAQPLVPKLPALTKPVATPQSGKMVAKPLTHPAAPGLKPQTKSAAIKPLRTPSAATHSFVPTPLVTPGQPVATAPLKPQPSVSAAARSMFVAKPPVLTAPKPIAVAPGNVPSQAPMSSKPKPLTLAVPKAAAAALKKPPVGKPAAGKPVLTSVTNSSPQAVPQ